MGIQNGDTNSKLTLNLDKVMKKESDDINSILRLLRICKRRRARLKKTMYKLQLKQLDLEIQHKDRLVRNTMNEMKSKAKLDDSQQSHHFTLVQQNIIRKIRLGEGRAMVVADSDDEESVSGVCDAKQSTVAGECIICFQVLDQSKVLPGTLSACRHSFCGTCIVSWMDALTKKRQPVTCPMCRVDCDSIAIGNHSKSKVDKYCSTTEVFNPGPSSFTERLHTDMREYNIFIIADHTQSVCIDHEVEPEEVCHTCGVFDEQEKLLCDQCDQIFHMSCVGLRPPPDSVIPSGMWFCESCWGTDGTSLLERRLSHYSVTTAKRKQSYEKKFFRDRSEYLDLVNAEQHRQHATAIREKQHLNWQMKKNALETKRLAKTHGYNTRRTEKSIVDQ
eukprot:GHVH01007161.1.p1 GENE.GHVH01007161.1~~GHVH01007161.1.p1  ORF type:complete len:390 (+),score=47.04 GHVH01007161.1:27-1196(+)